MIDVAVVSFAQSRAVRAERERNEVEILMPVVTEAVESCGIDRKTIGFTCSGSTDYLAGIPFSFVTALDGIGAWPPIAESHVEMDGAWALYEAWVRLQHGDIDTALVYGFGKSSVGSLDDVLVLQTDPYTVAPLWPDAPSMAALQARAWLDAGKGSERDMAEVAVRNRRAAKDNPWAQVAGDYDAAALLAGDYTVAPLREHDAAPVSDGAAAIILAAGDAARRLCERPAWIRGIDHRIDPQGLGMRDLTRAPAARIAAERAGVGRGAVDVWEIYAPYTHQELILREEMGIAEDACVNPSGGVLGAHPMMAAGLVRIGEAARRIRDGAADRAVAHATQGPCLQQNLVCILEGE